ncbi:hypothetical protein BVRB_2g027070 [Beta vulgaris subsp. vulgaris]|nr:hypothetical protein BVRB_2g027070 [Beta vulgaris subsp. vulgaris]
MAKTSKNTTSTCSAFLPVTSLPLLLNSNHNHTLTFNPPIVAVITNILSFSLLSFSL